MEDLPNRYLQLKQIINVCFSLNLTQLVLAIMTIYPGGRKDYLSFTCIQSHLQVCRTNEVAPILHESPLNILTSANHTAHWFSLLVSQQIFLLQDNQLEGEKKQNQNPWHSKIITKIKHMNINREIQRHALLETIFSV